MRMLGFRLRWLLVLVGWIAWENSVALPAARAQSANPQFDALLQTGVAFPTGQTRKLRPPTLTDGMSQPAQLQAIQAVLAMRPGGAITYQEFTENNLRTKYVLLIDRDPQYDNGRLGHSVNLWFVVFGDLKTVSDAKFLKKQFKPDSTGRIDTLTADDLRERQIVPRQISGGNEWFVHGGFKLLETQVYVQVEGTALADETTTDESATLACQIDRRFDKDSKFPNEWRPVVNGVVQNSPQLYDACGGYAKVTKLVQPAGAMLLEYHLVYDIPQGWFQGKNFLLLDKLPSVTPDDVRSFRRDVRKAASQ